MNKKKISRFFLIKKKLNEVLKPIYMKIIDTSDAHYSFHGEETHFKIIVVTKKFNNKKILLRHKKIYNLLDSEWSLGLHSLELYTYSPDEWNKAKIKNK
ncbi:MAG: BolA family protein [Arsenophonus sp.]|nr:MAG: BolA family protein [Arsenophonus sp.]